MDNPAFMRSPDAVTDTEQLSALIGTIYDAVVDQRLWPEALVKVSAYVGGVSGALYAKDVARKTIEIYHHDNGIGPTYMRSYFDLYARFDPTTTAHFFAEAGQVISMADIMPWQEFLDTRFYREWVRPQGLGDAVNAVLDKSSTNVALFGVFISADKAPANATVLRRMNLILPHMRRAVLIGRVIDLKTAEAAAFGDVLDGLKAAVFFVSASGAIIHANKAGRALLRTGEVLREAGGRLTAYDSTADLALLDVFAKAARGDDAVGATGISVPLMLAAGGNHVAHVLPLTSGARSGVGHSAVAALFVHRAELATPSLPEMVAKAFRLTPSELRVLLAIVEVGGVPETAETLGVAETTVKTHLHRVFAKTGTRRQTELVKLVAGFSNPIVG